MVSLSVNRYRRGSNDTKHDGDPFGNDFELFDPWRDTNLNTSTSLRWINEPKRKKEYEEKVAPALDLPPHGDKYRVKIDISDYDPESIKTTIEGRLLIIEAKKKHDQSKNENEKKMYDLPEPVYEHAGKDTCNNSPKSFI